MKFRKKPVIVDAVVYQPGMEDGYVAYALNGTRIGYFEKHEPLPKVKLVPALNTWEGPQEISDGDYIVTGASGEKYLYKPDVFYMTFEPVVEMQ